MPSTALLPALPLTSHQQLRWMMGLVQQPTPTFAVAWRCPSSLTGDQLSAWWQEFGRQQQLTHLRVSAGLTLPTITITTNALPALASLPANDEPLALRLAHARERAWDLAHQSGVRASVLSDRDGDVLLLEAHPMICDEPSFQHLVRDFLALAAGSTFLPPPDPSQALQDLHAWMASAACQTLRATWKAYLSGVSALIDLPCDHPRQNARTEHARIAQPLGEVAIAALHAHDPAKPRSLGMGHGFPLVLLAATAVVCARITGQDDLVVGCLWRDAQPVPYGPFGGVWPARLDLRDDPTGSTMLVQARQAIEHIARHHHLPVADLIATATGGRRQEPSPLVQVLVGRDPQFSGPPFGEPLLSDPLATTSDLAFLIGIRGELILHYNRALFTDATAERLLAQVAAACDAIAQEPATRLSALRLQSAAEEDALCDQFLHRKTFPAMPCLHDLFAAQARERPTAAALTAADHTVTYGELDKRANRLAHRLVALGVGPDVLVGHCLRQSVDAVVAILAILKAGGAYVPLDPAHPSERLAATVIDAATPVVISDQILADGLHADAATLVLVDRDAEAIAALPDTPPTTAVQPHHLAYVIYTSGSTGRPKGVPITHAQVLRLFRATQDWYNFCPDDVWPLFHSLAFDVSVWELWGSLLHGGRLVLIDEMIQRSPADFHALILREGVTVLNQTPAAFYQFARANEKAEPVTALRLVIMAGEKLELSALSRWFARYGDEKPLLVNMYGITETTVHVTYRPLRMADLARPWISPIGVPIPDLSLYLLDSALCPVPTGVIGEMYVGGAGVGRGYLNRDDLTAARFLADPFCPGRRMYRSGDAARRLTDGELDYIGRLDQQVKIRGYRVELGEIEAVLRRHNAVADCAVTVHQSSSNVADRSLVAYVVIRTTGKEPPQPSELVIAALRAAANASLPSHMVPAVFMVLDRLPLTVNGKLDRRALPAPLPQAFAGPAEVVATTNAIVTKQSPDQGAAEHADNVAFWRARFEQIPDLPDLPSDRPRAQVRSFAGATARRRIDVTTYQGLEQAAARHHATLFTTLLTGLQTLIWRLSGQDDVVIGVPTAGQSLSGAAGASLVGHCVNFLPMRARIAGERSLADQLPALQRAVLDGFAHQDYTYGTLVAALGTRDPSRLPLTEIHFNLEHGLTDLHVQDQDTSIEANNRQHVDFDLFINVVESPDGLLVECYYNRNLFDQATIARWLGHYETLLKAFVAEPTLAANRLSLLTADERKWLVEDCNATAMDYPEDAVLHRLIEAQVERTPDADALSFAGTRLTYRDLNQRANRLAHLLQRMGVGPEVMVGVCAERSVEMVVALVAILKAGGAYVPLDPDYPTERLAYMITDAKPPVLLTQSHLVARLPTDAAQVVLLDRKLPATEMGDEGNPNTGVTAQNMAYVIYTSGSTGRPKGAINTHRGITNCLQWMQHTFRLTQADRVLLKTTFSFDVSVTEFFWPLITGARLDIAPPNLQYNSAGMATHIAERGITVVNFVPSLLHLFLQEPKASSCTALRIVIAAGEALSAELQDRFLAHLPWCALHNLYGPTEAAVYATAWECRSRKIFAGGAPIGRPLANTRVYILDALGKPQPVGIPGELHIGGVAVCRGYFARPELTTERFIADPFSNAPGARLYRTGDLARWHGDGVIEYLGRLDHQVKIRGQRIELGEIETVLRLHHAVADCAVTVHQSPSDAADRSLVAYVVIRIPEREPPLPSEQVIAALRAAAKARLPNYMVPAAFVVLDHLPLNVNGKLDRRALPVPLPQAFTPTAAFVAATSANEHLIARIWSQVLGREDDRERIGIDDHFFDIGGNSMHVVQVHALLEQALERTVPIVDLFQYPSVRSLAKRLDQADGTPSTKEQDSIDERVHHQRQAIGARRMQKGSPR